MTITVETTADRFARERRDRQDAADAAREAEMPGFVRAAAAIGADFSIRIHTAGQLRAVLETIGGHDNYDPTRAATLLGPLVVDAMSVTVKHYVAGPDILVEIPWTEAQTLGNRAAGMGMGRRFTNYERDAYARRVIAVGQTLKADEITTRQAGYERQIVNRRPGDRPLEIRLWWD